MGSLPSPELSGLQSSRTVVTEHLSRVPFTHPKNTPSSHDHTSMSSQALQ